MKAAIWRVDFEINEKRQLRDVQAQEVIGAHHKSCAAKLGVPFSWPLLLYRGFPHAVILGGFHSDPSVGRDDRQFV